VRRELLGEGLIYQAVGVYVTENLLDSLSYKYGRHHTLGKYGSQFFAFATGKVSIAALLMTIERRSMSLLLNVVPHD
jgi:hypothetical protein